MSQYILKDGTMVDTVDNDYPAMCPKADERNHILFRRGYYYECTICKAWYPVGECQLAHDEKYGEAVLWKEIPECLPYG